MLYLSDAFVKSGVSDTYPKKKKSGVSDTSYRSSDIFAAQFDKKKKKTVLLQVVAFICGICYYGFSSLQPPEEANMSNAKR